MSRPTRQAKDDAVDRLEFLDLYQSALSLQGKQRDFMLIALLLTGRLMMRIGEAIHVHDDWINWELGYIEVPEFEPCACNYCFQRSKDNCDPDNPSSPQELDSWMRYHYSNRWSAKTDHGARRIPFNWSPRVGAALAYLVEEYEVMDMSYQWFGDTLEEDLLPRCDLIGPNDLNWKGLRATGNTFWAVQGLGLKAQTDMAGWAFEKHRRPYSATSLVPMINEMRELSGKEPLMLPRPDYVTMDPREDKREPWSLHEFRPTELYSPFKQRCYLNPRSESVPEIIRKSNAVSFDDSQFDVVPSEKEPRALSKVDRRTLVDRIDNTREGEREQQLDSFVDPWERTPPEERERTVGYTFQELFDDEQGGSLMPGMFVRRLVRSLRS